MYTIIFKFNSYSFFKKTLILFLFMTILTYTALIEISKSAYDDPPAAMSKWGPAMGIIEIDLRKDDDSKIRSYFWWNNVDGFSLPHQSYEHDIRITDWNFLECDEVWSCYLDPSGLWKMALDRKPFWLKQVDECKMESSNGSAVVKSNLPDFYVDTRILDQLHNGKIFTLGTESGFKIKKYKPYYVEFETKIINEEIATPSKYIEQLKSEFRLTDKQKKEIWGDSVYAFKPGLSDFHTALNRLGIIKGDSRHAIMDIYYRYHWLDIGSYRRYIYGNIDDINMKNWGWDKSKISEIFSEDGYDFNNYKDKLFDEYFVMKAASYNDFINMEVVKNMDKKLKNKVLNLWRTVVVQPTLGHKAGEYKWSEETSNASPKRERDFKDNYTDKLCEGIEDCNGEQARVFTSDFLDVIDKPIEIGKINTFIWNTNVGLYGFYNNDKHLWEAYKSDYTNIIRDAHQKYDEIKYKNIENRIYPYPCNELGIPFDMGKSGDEYVHEWTEGNGVWLQVFKQSNPYCKDDELDKDTESAIVVGELENNAYYLRGPIWEKYKEINGGNEIGYPTSNEYLAIAPGKICQEFSNPDKGTSGIIFYDIDKGKTDWRNYEHGYYCIHLAREPVVQIDIEANGNWVKNNSFYYTGSNTDITFTINNRGTEDLKLKGNPPVNISPNTAFSVSKQPESVISPLESTTFEIHVDSSYQGSYEAKLQIGEYSYSNNNQGDELFNINIVSRLHMQFSDINESSSYYEAISTLYKMGVVDGYPDGNFRPNKIVNRAEFCKMLVRTAEVLGTNFDSDERNVIFPDVNSQDWFYPFVMRLANHPANNKHRSWGNIIKGYPDGTFQPSNPINIVEMAKMIVQTFDPVSPDLTDEHWYTPFVDKTDEIPIEPIKSDNGQWISIKKLIALSRDNASSKATRKETAKALYDVYLKNK